MNRPNRLRTWAWHQTLALTTVLALYPTIWIGVWAVHTLGELAGSLLLAALIALPVGTASWVQAGKPRP